MRFLTFVTPETVFTSLAALFFNALLGTVPTKVTIPAGLTLAVMAYWLSSWSCSKT